MIPFLDLKAQYESIKDEVGDAVDRTLSSGQFTLGAEVQAFEEEFAAFTGTQFGVGVNSGTSALHLALLAAGVGPGDEVITVSLTFVATVAAIDYCGATPVFVDVDPRSLNMDVNQLEAAITGRTKAILPVHLHGRPADLDPIMELACRYKLVVVEDAAQAHGASYKGLRAGSIGGMGCFSFYPGKNLGAYGEAGIVVTNSEEYAQTIRVLRDWGQKQKYQHQLRGFNYRMEALQGAILRVKLRYLDAWTDARRKHAAQYDNLLKDSGLRIPQAGISMRDVYHVYAVQTTERDRLQASLMDKQVHTGIHYPIPVHLQQAYEGLGYKEGDLPATEMAASELLSLPMYPELEEAQVETVCTAIREALPIG